MDLGTLRRLLEDCADLGDSTPVRICTQPNYPLRHDLVGVLDTMTGIEIEIEDALANADTESDEDEAEVERLKTAWNNRFNHVAGIDNEAHLAELREEIYKALISESGLPAVEIRLLASDGHPYEGSPYGNRDDWDNCTRH